jgi:hypothetical protein
MSLFSVGGNIPKVKIEAFEMVDFSGKAKGEITLPLVTTEGGLEQKYSITWNNGGGGGSNAMGESSGIRVFEKYGTEGVDEALTIHTIVDATGVYRVDAKEGKGLDKINFKEPNVQEYLTELKNIVYGYNEETHQPPYIQLTWGKIFADSKTGLDGIAGVYKGVLSAMNIKYDLFSAAGFPVRAKVELTFLPVQDPRKRPGGNSPDLTHIIEVKPGDNLPKLCNKIYDNSEYYHQVAEVNGLASAYAIKPGMKLVFPPLDKNTR